MRYAHGVCALFGVGVILYGAYDVYAKTLTPIGAAPLVSSVSVQAPAPVEPLVPVRILLPTIGVHAVVESIGTRTDGAMATPEGPGNVGWYQLGAKPGASGNAVFAGHVNTRNTTHGVFEHLSDIAVGGTVLVLDAQGRTLTFMVTQVEDYSNREAPLATIFATKGTPGVALITCSGDWNARARSYEKRLVVYAQLVSP